MSTDNKLRAAVRDLGRAELRELAIKIGTDRDSLTDFANLGYELQPIARGKLVEWYGAYELRRVLRPDKGRQGPIITSAEIATGIPQLALDSFIAGTGELTAQQLATLRDHVTGQLGQPKAKDGGLVGGASAPLPKDIARRGDALRVLSALPLADLEALVARLPRKVA